MATLAQATQATRTALKWIGIGIVVFIILRFILFPIAGVIYNRLFPKTPPPPSATFGQLPQIPFPQSENQKELQYEIKTTTGTLPQMATGAGTKAENRLPDRIAVYRIKDAPPNFLSLDRAREKVANIGFKDEGFALDAANYQWIDPESQERKIIFNIVVNEFHLTSKLASASAELTGPPPDKIKAIDIAINFLSSMHLLPQDLNTSKTKATFLKVKNGVLTKTTSLAESDYIKVNFSRMDIDNLPIVNAALDRSLISFLIKSGGGQEKQVASADYFYKTIDKENAKSVSIYPIKSARQALEDLKNGGGYIASSPRNAAVVIRKVHLAYYEGSDDLAFLLPVFVFEGDNDFEALVPAIRADLVE